VHLLFILSGNLDLTIIIEFSRMDILGNHSFKEGSAAPTDLFGFRSKDLGIAKRARKKLPPVLQTGSL
jgi:hypothetical protein